VYSILLTPSRSSGSPVLPEYRQLGWWEGWALRVLAAEREGSVEQAVEALSREVVWQCRQLTGRQVS
jgi:hypothetical protein